MRKVERKMEHWILAGMERHRVLEKKVNETQVSKTVFSHLNILNDVLFYSYNVNAL